MGWGQKFELNIINVGLEHPSRKNVLHCLKYFAAQSVNRVVSYFSQKFQKLISRDGGDKREGLFGMLEYMAYGKAG